MTTDIVVILDRSGSMAGIKSDVEGGFDTFIAEQAKLPDPAFVTLTQFDSEGIDVVYTRKPLSEVPKLKLEPRGMTPLLDAIGKTVVKQIAASAGSERTLVLIITDGLENASREWTKSAIKELLEKQQAAGWVVVYLAANVDAFYEAASIGVSVSTTSNYVPDSGGVQAAFAAASHSLTSYRTGGSANLTQSDRDKMTGI